MTLNLCVFNEVTSKKKRSETAKGLDDEDNQKDADVGDHRGY
jgi:hypothetical protein